MTNHSSDPALRNKCQPLLLLFLSAVLLVSATPASNVQDAVNANQSAVAPIVCIHSNPATCDPEIEGSCAPYQLCDARKPGSGCYAVWGNNSDGTPVVVKGCWYNMMEPCISQTECIARVRNPASARVFEDPPSTKFFCCCNTSRCNDNVRILEEPAEDFESQNETTTAANSLLI